MRLLSCSDVEDINIGAKNTKRYRYKNFYFILFLQERAKEEKKSPQAWRRGGGVVEPERDRSGDTC